MRTIAIAAAFICLGTGARGGDVRVFFTSSADGAGLTDTTHVFHDTDGQQTDGSSYQLKSDLPTIGVPTVDPAAGEFLYVWVEFEGVLTNAKIQGMNLVLNDQVFNGLQTESGRGVYLGNDQNGGGSKLRWALNSQTFDAVTLVAVDTPGIKNEESDGWLYFGSADGRRVALLGALKVDASPDGKPYEMRLGLGPNGISFTHAGDQKPGVMFGENDEILGPRDFPPYDNNFSTDADAVVVPEPGVLGLCIAAALFARRRVK